MSEPQTEAGGIRRLLVAHVDAAGVARARAIPAARVDNVLEHGIAASISGAALFTPADSPVGALGLDPVIGDVRVRPDARRVAELGDGWAWAPADLRWADDRPFTGCTRSALRRAATAADIDVKVGFEIEFVVADEASGSLAPAHKGPAYGQRPLVRNLDYLDDLMTALEDADVPVLQVHAEHGDGQFEVSLAPRHPVDACDDVVLARTVIDLVTERFGLRAYFDPVPPIGADSNGMHIHLSASRDGRNVFASTEEGMPHAEGTAIIAGILDLLPSATALLAGSESSYKRLRPGRWSGAWNCWGRGNREAAVRYTPTTTDAGPSGANIEIKPGDATANPYLAVAALLVGLRAGLDRPAEPPAPVDVDPGRLSDDERSARGVRTLPASLADALAELSASGLLREGLGDDLVDLYIAVRTPAG
ncbi:gamma-glutamylpolyamine synthetase GlnA3 [Microbacterium awajiense]|uniref:Gamma-glutamylpolyamine synthetase GlnA3 n=1 Tax=Microbacterium awajiense TaxID=415214 RepID=A0ABP7A1G9_9MICO